MALTLLQASKEIQHELGGRLDARISALDVCNRAGEHVTQMRAWKFLKRGPVSLTIRANTPYVDLPDGAQEITKIEVARSLTQGAHPTTSDEIAELMAGDCPPPYGTIYYAPSYVETEALQGERGPRLVLLIYPQQETELVDFLTCTYRVGWTPLTALADSTVLCGSGGRFPEWMTSLYVQTLRAFAAGYERPNGGTLDERLAHIQSGPIYDGAVRRDIKVARTAGVLGSLPTRQMSWEHGDALPPS